MHASWSQAQHAGSAVGTAGTSGGWKSPTARKPPRKTTNFILPALLRRLLTSVFECTYMKKNLYETQQVSWTSTVRHDKLHLTHPMPTVRHMILHLTHHVLQHRGVLQHTTRGSTRGTETHDYGTVVVPS